MRVNVAATRTNLLRIEKSLSLTREGHELLDEKRRILLSELSSLIHVVDRMERELEAALRDAYAAADRTAVAMGEAAAEDLSFAADIKAGIAVTQRRIMGVAIPTIAVEFRDTPPHYSPHGASASADETAARFRKALETIAELAGKKVALLRLAREVQKTIRKVNALEKVYIPFYTEARKQIGDRLDEESRDSFSMLKSIKRRMKDAADREAHGHDDLQDTGPRGG